MLTEWYGEKNIHDMITIQQTRLQDVNTIVRIHKEAFPNFFLTSLGSTFLHFYYRCMIKSKEAITLCAIYDGAVVGFSTTALSSNGFNKRLVRQNVMRFGIEGIKLLLLRPKALIRLIRNFTKKSDVIDDACQYAELFSFGVSPAFQGLGAGRALLSETENIVSKMGGRALSLTTDKKNNDSAIAFYQSCGYQILYEFTAYPDRKMFRFIKKLE